MDGPGSVTRLLDDLRSEDPAARDVAAQRIWAMYFPPLLEMATRQLSPGVRRRVDGDDVLQDMYKSFCVRMGRGEFVLEGRDSLWRLLVTMTLNKARKAATRQHSAKRDVRREKDGGADDAFAAEEALAQLEQEAPTPAEALELAEGLQRRLQVLSGELRQLALWKLEGFTNREIAAPDKMDCAERTVERKLDLIRSRWEAVVD